MNLNTDSEKFGELLKAMAATFQAEVDSAMTTGYLLALADLPLDKVQVAMIELMRTHKYSKMPQAGAIRELAEEAMAKEEAEKLAETNKQRKHDRYVVMILRDAVQLGRGREYVEAECRRIGDGLRMTLTVDAWLLEQLGDVPLAKEWPELKPQTVSAP